MTSNSIALDRQIHLAGGRILLGEICWKSKVYPGVLILWGLCGDIVVFVWNYHVLSLPDHVRFWNRNQNLWSRLRIYKAHSDTEFKTRYGNHKKSFCHRRYEKDTELSKYIWELKDQNKNFEIKWSIYRKSCGYNQVAKSCNLCLMEKVLICNFKDKERLINKRVDLVSKCRHENKFILLNYSGVD